MNTKCHRQCNKSSQILFQCSACGKSWHPECHIPRILDEEIADRLRGTDKDKTMYNWACRRCLRKQSSANINEMTTTQAKKRLGETKQASTSTKDITVIDSSSDSERQSTNIVNVNSDSEEEQTNVTKHPSLGLSVHQTHQAFKQPARTRAPTKDVIVIDLDPPLTSTKNTTDDDVVMLDAEPPRREPSHTMTAVQPYGGGKLRLAARKTSFASPAAITPPSPQNMPLDPLLAIISNLRNRGFPPPDSRTIPSASDDPYGLISRHIRKWMVDEAPKQSNIPSVGSNKVRVKPRKQKARRFISEEYKFDLVNFPKLND